MENRGHRSDIPTFMESEEMRQGQLIRNFSRLLRKRNKKKQEPNQGRQVDQTQDPLHQDLDQNVDTLRSIYANCFDIVYRTFLIGGKIKATLIYFEGLVNMEEIDDNLIAPLMLETAGELTSLKQMVERKIAVSKVQEFQTFTECIEMISTGNPILLCDGERQGLALGLIKLKMRAIEEPTAESGIRGPREGFTESLGVNTSLLRRTIKSPALKMQSMKIGSYTNTNIVIAYIEGIADKTLIEEVENRLKRIEIDGILDSGYIEEMIEDNPFSPFPQIKDTERPDIACSGLLEGKVVILVDGSPFSLIAPTTFFSLFQSQEDYYQRFLVSSLIRWLRYFFLMVSLLLPSLYVAVLTFHQEMVPTSLLISMASARETVPFPAIVEALIMEITFEGLREAGVRLPKQVGSAVSIVGALVIGQAAVQAGLVSAPMVIVVAITGIASFMIPRYSFGSAIRMLRFPIILLSGTLGLLGVMLAIIAIVVHLCTLRSFGVPYLTPVAPLKFRELKDVAIRAPWWMMDTRPHLTGKYNEYRQAPGQKPDPGRGNET